MKYYFKGNNSIEKCMCEETMNNEHLYSCILISEARTCNLSYTQLFNGNLHEQHTILNILHQNMKHFETLTQAQ